MPHTNRKKKTTVNSNKPTNKPTIVHTKRKEIQDDDGWTHVVDTPRARRATVSKAANGGLQVGDFEIGGVSYVNRTLEEMKVDFQYWKKGWEENDASGALRDRLLGKARVVKKEEKADDKETESEGEKPVANKGEEIVAVKQEEKLSIVGEEQNDTESPAQERMLVDNIIVLGLGSLQSARREGRRASATQLAALQTITQTLGAVKDLKVMLQDPQFTPLDKEFLISLGYEIMEDPEAFIQITESSLVYAIHCYAQAYKTISEGKKPAILIGTDVENFGRFNLSETADMIQKGLEEMVRDCEVMDFPQVRHDFSDTKIYWRRTTSTT